jgi:phosphate/sulfate permease
MPDLFLIIVILLFALAVTDLVVGVSNDAVNFLNSAIGSKVGSRRQIMIVASLGIFFGAALSSGMMEVARKGIFNPAFFTFMEIMILFLAVMLTDIILLDLFNTFGMPTSTTVSIVFELLGAAVALAVIKSMGEAGGLSGVSEYINSSSALAIITGIFLSVGIAFTVGALVMYVSRFLFTFNYQQRSRWIGIVWSGLATAILFYFLFFKGLKGSGYVPASWVSWIGGHPFSIIGGGTAFFSGLMYILSRLGFSILRIVVLFGTFSLAMAFAGNDLVNFIGVPIAGFQSYRAWIDSGIPADQYGMEVLSGAYPTEPYLLVAAGGIMVITLWFSKKARSVTDTEVNLDRQSEGLERFSPNWLSRSIVRSLYGFSKNASGLLPESWREEAERRFEPGRLEKPKAGETYDPPAFDLVRASVNLTVASALIALATSFKLPLSTTYVSFMVAMGASLSDRAWGRDSAVYRVAGVLNVIGGWFATALIAFTVSAAFASLLFHFQAWAIGGLVLLAIASISRSIAVHKRREARKARREAYARTTAHLRAEEMVQRTVASVASMLATSRKALEVSLDGLLKDDLPEVRRSERIIEGQRRENREFRYAFYSNIGRIEEEQLEGSRTYLLMYDLEQDYLQSAEFIIRAISEHVGNAHAPLLPDQAGRLRDIQQRVAAYLESIENGLRESSFSSYPSVLEQKQELHQDIERLLAMQVRGIKKKTYSARNSLLFLSLVLEIKDLIAVAARFYKLYYRLHHYSPETPWTLVAGK